MATTKEAPLLPTIGWPLDLDDGFGRVEVDFSLGTTPERPNAAKVPTWAWEVDLSHAEAWYPA